MESRDVPRKLVDRSVSYRVGVRAPSRKHGESTDMTVEYNEKDTKFGPVPKEHLFVCLRYTMTDLSQPEMLVAFTLVYDAVVGYYKSVYGQIPHDA